MTPQLWIQFLTFQDWRLTHPDLTDQEATLLYKAELQLFQNYQDEILNQTLNRQTQLSDNLLNLSADIDSILTEGGGYRDSFRYTADYLGFRGQKAVNPNTGEGRFIGSGTVFEVGDLFSYEITIQGGGGNISQNGIYRVVLQYTLPSSSTPGIAITRFTTGLAAGFFEKIALLDGTPL